MQFTEQQWWKMCDVHLSLPVRLSKAVLTKPWIYSREHGLFYCPPGYHIAAMALLFAFDHGSLDPMEALESKKLDRRSYAEAADWWLTEKDGRAFKSSAGSGVQAGNVGQLTPIEARIFNGIGQLIYIGGFTYDDYC